jgi:hypothetical protein
MKKILGTLFCFALIFATLPTVFAAEKQYSDVPQGHWAYDAITAWSSDESGNLQGYGDGRFGPDDAMRDVDLNIVLARLLGGDAPIWRDSAPVTREAAAKALAQTLGLEPVDEPATLYADDAAIGAEFRAYIYALRAAGVQQGVPGNEYKPKAGFTRAELVQSAYNAISSIADGNVTGMTYEKALIVRKPGLTVKDSVISGDLIVGYGVGEGDLTLDGVNVSGRVVVYGGGSHSIIIKNGSRVAALVAGKANVRVQLENGVTIQSIEIVENGVEITVQKGATVETLTIGADGATIGGEGVLTSVTVKPEAVGAIVNTPNTIIINNSESYVTTASGVVKAGDTQTTPPAVPGTPSGGGGGSNSGTPSEPGIEEPRTVEVATTDELVKLIKDGPQNVRVVVTEDMAITPAAVGMYQPFDVYELLFIDNVGNSTLYIPQGVKLTIEDVTFLVNDNTELEIDGTLLIRDGGDPSLQGSIWIGSKLTLNGELICQGVRGALFSSYATVGGAAASIANISLPEKSYGYDIEFKYVNGVYTDGNIFSSGVASEQQLRDAVADGLKDIIVFGIFDITSPIAPNIGTITDENDTKLTIKSEFTVQDTLRVAGEIAGAEGGKVIIPANAQIKNVLWGGGWVSDEYGTGVLHGLPTDSVATERVYNWQDGEWTLQP